VVVAAAEEDDVLAALYKCKQKNISDAILVGHPDKIRKALILADVPEETFEIVATDSDEESALKTAEIASKGDADVVMKGYLKTSILLKTLLKSENGLRDRELVSHSALLYVPRYGKLLNITDGGTMVRPSIDQKLTAIANGVSVLRAAGIQKPRVAVIGPVEEVSESHPETIEAKKLVDAANEIWSDEMFVEGPLPVDLATNLPENLGVDFVSEVAGKADMIMVHTLEEGNILAKTLIQFGGAIFMGVIAGAKVPISLVSRSDSMLNKMSSIALAVCLADYQRRDFASLPSQIVGE
jgi:phosphate butyryltransferase